jgi:hypothetical protein
MYACMYACTCVVLKQTCETLGIDLGHELGADVPGLKEGIGDNVAQKRQVVLHAYMSCVVCMSACGSEVA